MAQAGEETSVIALQECRAALDEQSEQRLQREGDAVEDATLEPGEPLLREEHLRARHLVELALAQQADPAVPTHGEAAAKLAQWPNGSGFRNGGWRNY